ncbi:unnamed protein product [Rotaria sp. Silwood1]|nr:unnamed protein product [Rotaria sp. Silwood1]CAF4886848.1 unnamed protein product [Rotaria sp. Silwood1]
MRFMLALFFSIFLSYVKVQVTSITNYYCDQNNAAVQFTLTSSSHTAWQPVLNCSLQQCNASSNNNGSCRSSLTPCFD